jgi:ABC-2 type transport system permease protein
MSRAQLRSEWLKLRSLPSTYVVILAAVVLGLGISTLEMSSTAHHWASLTTQERTAFDPVADSFSGFQFAELAFGALGVLTITAEYSSGTIGPTLVALPRRLQVLLGKVLVLSAVVLPICVASAVAAFLAGQLAVRGSHLGVSLNEGAAQRAVLMAGLYLFAVTLVGLGLGAIIRHTGGALTVMFAVVFLAWPMARAIEGISYIPDRWLLVNAADVLVSAHPVTGPNAPRTPSFAMACVELVTYVVVLLGMGAWRVTRDI